MVSSFCRCLILALLSPAIVGCYPGGFDSAEESDTVITSKEPGAVFQGRRTYALNDEVIDLCDVDEDDDTPSPCENTRGFTHSYDSLILSTITENMNRLGYDRIDDPENDDADVVILVGGAQTQVYVYDNYCESWWYFWSGWPGWGPYPPGGGGSWGIECTEYEVLTDIYDVGTLVINMVDAENADVDSGIVPNLWLAVMNGIGGGGDAAPRLERGIDQAFAQSPYLESSAE